VELSDFVIERYLLKHLLFGDDILKKVINFEDVFNSSNIRRFLDKVEIKENGCIEWIAGRDVAGYGVFSVRKDIGEYKAYKAHRFALELSLGQILSSDIFACHHCDNPGCVSPDHLFPGTNRDNVDDMLSKGRSNRNLSDEQVRSIRRDILLGNDKIVELAKKHGTKSATISAIKHGKTYKYVK
jgi:HNH endonuclease